MSKVLHESRFGSLPSFTETNPRDHVKSISISVETETTLIRRMGSSQYAVSAQQISKLIFESRQVTIPFLSRLDNYYCDEKGSYGPQYLDTCSYGATRLNDALPRKEKDPGSFTLPCYINNVCFEKALADLGASINRIVKHPKGITENVLVGIGKFVFPIDFIILDMPEDVNVPLILGRPFLSTAHAKVDVFKRKITLRRKMNLNLEARLMGETLILNRSFDPLYGDYIELNDLNEPQELRINRVNDLEPTIEEGEVVNKPIMKIVKTRCGFIGGLDDYRIDYAYNLKFSCMIGFEYVYANFLPILPINVMSKKFYNTIMKDKIEFRRRNELGNFVNAPVFIGNFYVITDFIVVEDMDPYPDEGIGDVIVGEPFCKASCVEARRFDGIITIRDGDDSVTYQMVRANPRFKHLTNEKCNKIPPLLKVSKQDKMNGISHPYQKLKGFYKGVLNIKPDFIRDAKMEEWLTRGHISVHEME
ncbi:homeodomain-like protein [Tanacetum coccineum]|uniref:Homeodomain-like protein n=1 Tax=Tanacetum coccineum TaxID=301880 RepID=A0ABQ5AK15_9ASTR